MLVRIAGLVALIATPAVAEEFPVHLADGATWTITAEHSRKVEGDKPQAWRLTTTKRLTWHAAKAGAPARMTVTPLTATSAPGSPAELASARSLAIPADIEVDESLSAVRILNHDATRAAFIKLVPAAAGGDMAMVDASTMAMIASEIGIAARVQGLSLSAGKRITAAGELPLLGTTVKTEESAELTSYDPKSRNAVVLWRETLDPASYREAVGKMLAPVHADMDPAKLAEMKATLAKISVTGENNCRAEIDGDTGLATKLECSFVQNMTDGTHAQRSTEAWTITQSLPEKS